MIFLLLICRWIFFTMVNDAVALSVGKDDKNRTAADDEDSESDAHVVEDNGNCSAEFFDEDFCILHVVVLK